MKSNKCSIGDVVEVQPIEGGQALPDSLPAGAQVRLVKLGTAFGIVERDGREWRVAEENLVPRAVTGTAVPTKPLIRTLSSPPNHGNN